MHRRASPFLLVGVSAALTGLCTSAKAAHSNNILITGYWPPTNNMVRQFSPNPDSNPSGWRGRNWEARGFDIVSHFPEFPGQTGPDWGKGVGDFEVDYQDTWSDWQRISAEVRPVAIITFSREPSSLGWTIEPAAQRFRLHTREANPADRAPIPAYVRDYAGVRVPDAPEFVAEPVGTIRFSTLPMADIRAAVASGLPSNLLDPNIPPFDPAHPDADGYSFGGSFLSGFIAYQGTWYQARHSDPSAPDFCAAAGHIHVGTDVDLAVGIQAVEITLRALIAHLQTLVTPCPTDLNDDGVTDETDFVLFSQAYEAASTNGDLDADHDTDLDDFVIFAAGYDQFVCP